MFKAKLLLLLALAIPFMGFAQRKKKSKEKSNPTHSLLWEISGNGLSKPSYLFGTIHAACPAETFIPDKVRNLIAKERLLVTETGGMEDMENPLAMVGLSAMGRGATLPLLLPDSSYQLVKKFFLDSLGLDIKPFERMKPLLLVAMIYPKMLGCQPLSSEWLLEQLNKEQGAGNYFLEKPEFQLKLFDQIDYRLQAEGLVDAIKNYRRYKKDLDFLILTYRDEDLDGIQMLVNSTSGLGDNFQELLLDNRNRNWMETLPGLMSEKSCLIAVGAGHLPGENGLITLLTKKGYLVKPIH